MSTKDNEAKPVTHAFKKGMASGTYRGGQPVYLCAKCSTPEDSAKHPKNGAAPTQPEYPPKPVEDRGDAILGEGRTDLGDES